MRRIHTANLATEQHTMRKFEKSIKKSFGNADKPVVEHQEEEWEEVNENNMDIEKSIPKIKKIKKNKILQKRTVIVEKKRLRKARHAPILVTHKEMDLE